MPSPSIDRPVVRLLGPPALLQPQARAFAPERRYRLAAVLAARPNGLSRDEAAALFWPDRNQERARSNLRKLIQELRQLELPDITLDGARLVWPVASDALTLIAGGGDAAAAEPDSNASRGPAPAINPATMLAGTPMEGTRLKEMHPAKAAVEPTDKSKFPLAIARVIPSPRMATRLALVITLSRLSIDRKRGVSTLSTTPTTSTTTPIL
jgi:hypothetical protein